MFENDIKEIKEALENSLAIKSKMDALCSEYEALQNKLYVDMYTRSYTATIYNEAVNRLRYTINGRTGFKNFHLENCGYSDNCQDVLENNFAKALTINNQSILDEFKKTISSRHCYEKNNRFTIKDDCIDLLMDFGCYKKIILNTLNILINGEIETEEISQKIDEVLKNENTFIYRNIKITTYKNGKTKLVFGDDGTLKKMINLLTNKEATT